METGTDPLGSVETVAGGAENIVALLTAFQHLCGDFKGIRLYKFAIDLPGVEVGIGAKVIASHGVGNQLA